MQARPDGRSNGYRQKRIDRKRSHDDERERGTVEPHHSQEDDGKHDVQRDRDRMAGQELADLFQLTYTGDRIADASGFKIGHGKRQDMPEELSAQADIDSIRRMRKQVGSEPAYNRFEDRQRDHTDRQHMERREPLVYEYFVDDNLCKERRQQGKELEKERCNQHFAEKFAIFQNGWKKPCEVEFEILQTDRGSFGKEQ